MRSVKSIIFFAVIIVAAWGYTLSAAKIKDFRKQLPVELVRREATMVDQNFLKIISGEFKGVLANYLLLKAAIIDGGKPEKMTIEDWDAVYILYKRWNWIPTFTKRLIIPRGISPGGRG